MKKIAIVGANRPKVVLDKEFADTIIQRAKDEVDRILNLEKSERPAYGTIVLGSSEGLMSEAHRVSVELMREAARLEIPIVVCYDEQLKEIEAMEEGKMEKILKDFRETPPTTFKMEAPKVFEITRMPEAEAYLFEENDFNRNSFGGQKQGRNRKLNRR